ncbi:MAG: SDR family oxidoreductase [Candidatus Cryptobacteroides sp.]|nr:SDR family oxidoreductase [Rikenellaceae bacterium]MDY5747138.1 SDR family oxidoreductase [Candidatus Cryptobacteroides sp.]
MVILITGITSGFGKAMAEKLSSQGHKVYGTHRKAVEHIPGVTYIKAEATDDAQVEAAVRQVIDAEGRIDVFINNAGMGIGGPLELSSLEDASRQMDVNWMGMVRFLHHVLPQMRRQGGGKILCFSSIGGLIGLPYQGLYSASKFAIEGYCEALRLEVRDFGIKVILIEPGDFATNFTAQRKSVATEQAAAIYPSYERSLKGIEKDEMTGLKPEFLAEKVAKILTRRNPRYSYIIASPLQKLAVLAKTILPRRLFYWILSLYYNL